MENEEAHIKSNKKDEDEDEEEDYDEDKLDEWEDRYSGHSYLAANALQLMIQDFPQVSLFRYLSKDREICLAWLNSHIQSYKFKPKTDWRSNDGMVSRMRYMIFEDESLEK